MKPIVKLVSLLLLAVLVFVPLRSASAQGMFDGQVIFGQSYTLKSGETLTGDLVVFGGSVVIEKDATVKGNVMVIGGTLVINGEVTGDAANVGGSVDLGPESHIYGNLATVGATLTRTDGAQIDGQITNTATSWTTNGNNGTSPVEPIDPVTPPSAPKPNISFDFNPLASVMNAFSQAIGWGLLAMLVMFFLSSHAGRVSGAIMNQPLTAGGLGLLTLVVAPIAIVILCVTILLIPAALVAIVALVVAAAFGWIAIGHEIGLRFTKAIHQEWHPALSAGLGTFALSLLAAALTGIPVLNCVGWLVPFLLGIAGLGAVIMTRFGTQVMAPVVKAEVAPPEQKME
jgi:cytoskeletal protein CcmA (bactofilin family)